MMQKYFSSIFIHQNPVSFPRYTHKKHPIASLGIFSLFSLSIIVTNLILGEGQGWDTFQSFIRAYSSVSHVSLGLFNTWMDSWVGRPVQEFTAWHAWAIALIRTSDQRLVLVIYKCEPKLSTPLASTRILRSTQRNFVSQFKRSYTLDEVWYNQNITRGGQMQCLRWSIEWMNMIASYGDYTLWDGDSRLQDCIQLDLASLR